MLAQKVFAPIAVAINNTIQERILIQAEREEPQVKDKMTTTHQREGSDSMIQIKMLTNDFKNFPRDLATLVQTTIMSRLQSYYGYILVPVHISDTQVLQVLKFDDPQDKYFMQMNMQLNLDFSWYDAVGRHVMVWCERKQTMDVALWAIERWLGLDKPPRIEDFREERDGEAHDSFNKHD
jgi:hypothetical protein